MGSNTLKIVGMFIFFILVVSITVFGLFQNVKPEQAVPGLSKEDVQKIVKNYIENNPELILTSVTEYQQRSQRNQEKDSQAAILQMKKELEDDPTSPIVGNPDGDVAIVEFFDYSCGYCKRVLPSITKLLEEDKNIKVVFKEFPILGPNSNLAARAALAVHVINPDKYFDFHKKLMEVRVSGKDAILKIATDIGMDADEVSEKMYSKEVETAIETNKQLASKIGIRGTPAFTINGDFSPGAISYETFKQKIREARADNES